MVRDRGRKTSKYGGTFGSENVKIENSECLFMEFKCFVDCSVYFGLNMTKNPNFDCFAEPSTPSKLLEITWTEIFGVLQMQQLNQHDSGIF